jgi:hypothetical protein
MRFFIDEGGLFTPQTGWGVVCSLTVPHKDVGPTRREIERLTRNWPRKNGELKGGLLQPSHLGALVDVLFRHDALMHACAIDVARQEVGDVARHKSGQCEGITKYLAPTHHLSFIRQVWELRRTLERMPNQLYIQFVLMSELVNSVVEEATMYFAQRRPRELAQFEWTIDAKDPTRVSPQEEWWRDVLGPLSESRSRTKPWGMVRDPSFDYRFLEKNFLVEKELWSPDRPRERTEGFDIKKMITDRMSFVDSRTETFIQAVDILASFLRRLLADKIEGEDVGTVARSLGRLQIIRNRGGKPQSLQMLTISNAPHSQKRLGGALRTMTGAARSMMKGTARAPRVRGRSRSSFVEPPLGAAD